ncbi:dTMP kinase [Candidatus Altiarchaeota archaeon]
MFIVLEGLDGCGKSTQARLLAEWLEKQGKDALLTAEPTKNSIGKAIREILAGEEEIDPRALSLLFTSDRGEHLVKEVEPALKQGKIVVSERYYYSTISYQNAQGVDWDWLVSLNDFRKPDLAFLLEVPADWASKRIRDKIEEEREKAQKAYKKFQEEKKKFEEHKKKFEEHRKRFQQLKKKPNILSESDDVKKLKHYFDTRNIKLADKQLRNLLQELLELDESRLRAEEDHEKARSKYLKFEKFERPTTLESETSEYDIFLRRVSENYHRFDDFQKIDGTQDIEEVHRQIISKVGERLG